MVPYIFKILPSIFFHFCINHSALLESGQKSNWDWFRKCEWMPLKFLPKASTPLKSAPLCTENISPSSTGVVSWARMRSSSIMLDATWVKCDEHCSFLFQFFPDNEEYEIGQTQNSNFVLHFFTCDEYSYMQVRTPQRLSNTIENEEEHKMKTN